MYGVSPQPGARARVLEQRLQELRRLVVDLRQIDARGVRQIEEERVVVPLGVPQRRLRVHVDRLVPGIGPILGRADVHAQVAARAVLRRHLNRIGPRLELESLVRAGLERRRRAGQRGRLRTPWRGSPRADRPARTGCTGCRSPRPRPASRGRGSASPISPCRPATCHPPETRSPAADRPSRPASWP